jgi:hypothetical protein
VTNLEILCLEKIIRPHNSKRNECKVLSILQIMLCIPRSLLTLLFRMAVLELNHKI